MTNLLMQHAFWTAVAISWTFSAVVSAMPKPNDQRLYLWLYGFCHAIAGNMQTVMATKFPALRIPPFAILAPLVLAVPA